MMTTKIVTLPMRGRITNRVRRPRRAVPGAQRRAYRAWMSKLTLGELAERAERFGNPLVIHGGRA